MCKRCVELEDPHDDGLTSTSRHVLMLLAGRIQALSGEVDDLNKRIAAGVDTLGLTEQQVGAATGLGPSASVVCSPIEYPLDHRRGA
ncbi:hypothetical protein ABH932_002393 [Streptacidiphilus sp. MAP5-52]